MRQFDRLNSILRYTLMAIATVIPNALEGVFSWFQSSYIVFFFVVPSLVVASWIADISSTTFLDRFPRIRRRLAGKLHFEGSYVSVVFDVVEEQLRFCTYSTLAYSNGKFLHAGDNWSPSGIWLQDFKTTMADFDDGELTCAYTTGYSKTGGFHHSKFLPYGEKPQAYIGRFTDLGDGKVYQFVGVRISDNCVVANFKNTIQERKSAALKFLTDYMEGNAPIIIHDLKQDSE